MNEVNRATEIINAMLIWKGIVEVYGHGSRKKSPNTA